MTVHIMQPKNIRDRESIYRFLYEIWSDEFCRSMEGMNHELRLMRDDLDETAQHLVAFDQSGRIVGCVRANNLCNTALPESLKQKLKTEELVKLFGGGAIHFISHFAVAPEARGKTVASLLLSALYRLGLIDEALVGISYCALHLIPFYYQLGFRPYTENFRLDAGVRVPIVHCTRDLGYLKEIQSPLARLCPKEIDDMGVTAQNLAERFPAFKAPGFAQSKEHHLWARLAHITPSNTAKKISLFEGLSESEKHTIERRSSEITFAQGEYVYRRGEIEPGMGVLVSGSFGVEVSVGGVSRVIAIILPGEPFGEIGSLGDSRRTADLVALENSQTVFFPFDFLERIGRTDTELGFKLANRLLKIVVGRFINSTNRVVQELSSTAGSLRPRNSTSYLPPEADEINSRIESYRFDSLGDRQGEFKRLVAQATIGEDLELSVLNGLGLRDGAKVLDLGSGPGVTTLLIAKRLPKATIIGVEPGDLLRKSAKKLIAGQGFSKHCRFLKGTGDRIPLGDGEVDFSYARFLFQHLPNPREVLGEMRRVTGRGGKVVILDVDDRTNNIYPAPEGLDDLEKRIADTQAAAGGDRHVGRKLYGYMHEAGLQEVGVELIPITSSTIGREAFFSIVYSFKRQVMVRADVLDDRATAIFLALEALVRSPTTFAMTVVYAAHGVVP